MSTPPSTIFPDRLRAARELRQLSQAELAHRAELQPSAVSHFETGTRKPSFDNLRRIADALRVTTDYLLGRSSDPMGIGIPDRLHRNLERLTDEDREFAERFLEMLAERSRKRHAPGA